jgi:hypothetical protein
VGSGTFPSTFAAARRWARTLSVVLLIFMASWPFNSILSILILVFLGGLGVLGGSTIVLDLPPCPVDRAWKARLIHVLCV